MNREKIISSTENLKDAMAEDALKDVYETLLFLKAVFPNDIQKKIELNHSEYVLLEKEYLNELINFDSYSIALNKNRLTVSDLINSISAFLSDGEYTKAIEYLTEFEQGKLAYEEKDWVKSKMHFQKSEELFIPNFEETNFELKTKKYLSELNSIHSNHINQTAIWQQQIEEIRKTKEDNFLSSDIFLNHPLYDKIIFDPRSYSFQLIVHGDYKVKYLDRWYETIKIPKYPNLDQYISDELTTEYFQEVIADDPAITVSRESLTFYELEEIHPLNLSDCEENSIFIVNEKIVSTVCETCTGHGKLDCKNCEDGLNICSKCKGNGKIECSRCRGSKHITCLKCNGKGQQHNGKPCDACESTGKVDCSNCSTNGIVTCTECKGSGRLQCKTCKGRKEIQCTNCRGTGGFYFIPYITTEVKSSVHDISFQYNAKENVFDKLPKDIKSRTKELDNFLFNTDDIHTFYRTDGHDVEFEADDIQKILCEKGREINSLITSRAFPLILEEKTTYRMSPCLTTRYSFLYDMKNSAGVYFLQHQEKASLLLEGEENTETIKLKHRPTYMASMYRAISSKKQFEIDDRFNETMLLLYIFKEDYNLSLIEKKVVGPILSDIFTLLSKNSQNLLIKILTSSHELKMDQLPLKFSTQTAAIESIERIKKNSQEQQLSIIEKTLEELKIKAVEASPKKINYVGNFIYHAKYFILIIFFIITCSFLIFNFFN